MADKIDHYRIAYYHRSAPTEPTLYSGAYDLKRAIDQADYIIGVNAIDRVQIWPMAKGGTSASLMIRIKADRDGG